MCVSLSSKKKEYAESSLARSIKSKLVLHRRRGPELSNEHSMIIFPIARCPNCPLNYTFLSTHPSLCGCSGGHSNSMGVEVRHQRAVYSHPSSPALATSDAFQQAASQRLRLHAARVQPTPAVSHKRQQLNSWHFSFNMHSCLDSCETPEHRNPKNPENKGPLSTICVLQKIPQSAHKKPVLKIKTRGQSKISYILAYYEGL